MQDKKGKIKNILDDLYMIDKDLKKHGKDLEIIVEKLLDSKPEVEINKKFVEDLKLELLKRADALEEIPDKRTLYDFIKNISYALGGATVCALLFVSINLFSDKSLDLANVNSDLSEPGNKIQKVEDEAFGSLAVRDEQEASQPAGAEMSALGNNATVGGRNEVMGLGAGDGGSVSSAPDAKLILPLRNVYNYVYKGEDIDVPKSKMAVYKRSKSDAPSNSAVERLKDINFLADTSKLDNLQVPSIILKEDKDFGYNFNFNFEDNSLSIFNNWERWPNVYETCEGLSEECYEQKRLKISDVPGDEDLIKTADAFLNEYNINRAEYDKPLINKDWLLRINNNPETEKYIPERVSVIYPLKIEDKNVYSEYGRMEGMVVEVDVRSGKAASVRNIFPQTYEKSDYAISDDKELIMKVLSRGGNNIYYGYGDNERKTDIEVGDPEFGLVKIWKYEFEGEKQVELYAPCLVFPIIGEVENGYYDKQNVVVPLIEDLINVPEDNDTGIEPMPMPMPMPMLRE